MGSHYYVILTILLDLIGVFIRCCVLQSLTTPPMLVRIVRHYSL